MSVQRKWDIANETTKEECIRQILDVLDEAQGRPPGVLLAEELIQIVGTKVGPEAYNTALEDARKIMQTKLEDLDVDIDLLTQK